MLVLCLSLSLSLPLPILSQVLTNQVPDSVGSGLPDYDSVIWLFLPFFYGPLVFAVLYGLGALIYRIIKSVDSVCFFLVIFTLTLFVCLLFVCLKVPGQQKDTAAEC